MSPPRRRSARLASVSAAKKRATPDLGSVAEVDETSSRRTSRRVHDDAAMLSTIPEPSTPVSSALKPPSSEMHPSRFHSSTGAPSSALRLGFTDIPKDGRARNGQDGTPSKIKGIPNCDFTFRVPREDLRKGADMELSTDAHHMLHEIRDQAAKIKAELVAKREAEGGSVIGERLFARPKGKVGRFSAAHMAEFKKMDSIEGHASAWRAQDGRFTPVKALKRTSSKANLDATPTSQRTDRTLRSAAKTDQEDCSNVRLGPSLKRKSSAADLDGDGDRQAAFKRHNSNPTPGKFSTASRAQPSTSAVKRVKQRRDDDATTTRPQSLIPSPSKPSSVFSRLATPKKTPVAPSLAYTRSSIKPTLSLAQSHSKTILKSPMRYAPASSLNSTVSKGAELKRRIISPRSFSKVKAILQGPKNTSEDGISAIPAPEVSHTPDARRVNKEMPSIPFTTPRRKLTKHVTFTPNVVTAVNPHNSPSPQRASNIKLRPALRTIETRYAALDDVLAQLNNTSCSLYPDLSPLKHLIDEGASPSRRVAPASPRRPDTFTFRSDRTMEFSNPFSSEFGASPGQISVRHVSSPAGLNNIPGSFPAPASPSSDPNKENNDPMSIKMLSGTAHGMQNKKRHRATSDEDDFESSRAAKKQKNDSVPEGQELLAPRLVKSGVDSATKTKTNYPTRTPRKTVNNRTPGRNAVRTPATTSPTKKTGGLSISRLNMLARPKNRA
ncbi:hypothetical protein E4U21_002717 [Claviceps maximensis]|nr:hypothetical protein E4U21_002717 [Claviceps maximensis]